jgi:uncharacterized UBP type Zn finger protein
MSEVQSCDHVREVKFKDLPAEVAGCEECLKIGGTWVNLRMCLECGKVGCCDASPSRHATGHHKKTGHPMIRSAQPGEHWAWCYVDELLFEDGV